jgi:hypothetical protein
LFDEPTDRTEHEHVIATVACKDSGRRGCTSRVRGSDPRARGTWASLPRLRLMLSSCVVVG